MEITSLVVANVHCLERFLTSNRLAYDAAVARLNAVSTIMCGMHDGNGGGSMKTKRTMIRPSQVLRAPVALDCNVHFQCWGRDR